MNIITCDNCLHEWKPRSDAPKYCPKCWKQIEYKEKCIKNPYVNQCIWISDKTCSMLLRKKVCNDEKLKNVIKRLISGNRYSETVRYKQDKSIYKITIDVDSKFQLCELMNRYNIKTFDEIIWRIL